MKKNDKLEIRHRAVIPYLGLKGKTPKHVYQDMEATLGEDALSYSKVKKWAGKFKRGRESPKDNPPSMKTAQCPILSAFPFSRSKWLETTNWLCLIICNRKPRYSYSFKLSVFSLIEQICTRANLQLYRTSASTLGRKLIKHPSYTVDLWICMLDDACHFWTEMFLCHSIEMSIFLERLYQSSPFVHHCKGKFMTNLEIVIICSRFFLFLKYSSNPMIAFFMTHPVCMNLHHYLNTQSLLISDPL